MGDELVIGQPPTAPKRTQPAVLPLVLSGLALLVAIGSVVVALNAQRVAASAQFTAATAARQVAEARAAQLRALEVQEAFQMQFADASAILYLQNTSPATKTQIALVRVQAERDASGRVTKLVPVSVQPQKDVAGCEQRTYSLNDTDWGRTWTLATAAGDQNPLWVVVWTDAWGRWQRVATTDDEDVPDENGETSSDGNPFNGPGRPAAVTPLSMDLAAAVTNTQAIELIDTADLSAHLGCG